MICRFGGIGHQMYIRRMRVYTGVTANLPQRVHQHRTRLIPGFTSRYGCTLLVWYERHDAMSRSHRARSRSRRDHGGKSSR
jgi:putative endonuclease